MARILIVAGLLGTALSFVPGGSAAAQLPRSFTGADKSPRGQSVPREFMPPRGMCRIWLDSVPARQQPAPTDCATAVRNKPRNAQVVFGEDANRKPKEKDDKKGEKDRKPEG